jgi:hypothetical protein
VRLRAGRTKSGRQGAARAAKRQSSDLVEKVIEDFIKLYARPNTRDWRETQRLLTQFARAWERRRLSEIGIDGIVARGAPIAANRAFAQIRKMCSWAVSRGIIERSPCADGKPFAGDDPACLVPATIVAGEFGISRRNLGRWFKEPKLEFPIPVQINKRLYFKRSELEAWKASRVRVSVREVADR